jgi:hypothetical protein
VVGSIYGRPSIKIANFGSVSKHGQNRQFVLLIGRFLKKNSTLGAQNLWVLMLCRSFFTPDRDIGSDVFMMWVLVQSGMLSCDYTVNTD